MEKPQSLADYLGVEDPPAADPDQDVPRRPAYEELTGKAFAEAVLNSLEFRRYITRGLTLGDLPAAVLTRLMDHGWGKPPERVEHTGRDGRPIETVTEVRRIVVRVPAGEDRIKDEVVH